MTKAQARKDYDKLSQAVNEWVYASMRLAKRVYAKPMLRKMLKSKDPYRTLHHDALNVLDLLGHMMEGE